MRHSHFGRRKQSSRQGVWWPVLVVPVVVLFTAFVGIVFFTRIPDRFTVAVAASPVLVWSWDTKEHSAIIMRIPEDTIVEGAYGYGKYSLKALWRLGVIDRKGGSVFAQSVSGALGIPVNGYIGSLSDDGIVHTTDSELSPRSLFSWISVHRFLFGGWRTDISFPQAVFITNLMFRMKSDAFETLDFAKRNLMYDEEMPDGTRRSTLDTDRVDAVLKSKFENPLIRKEALSVSLLNGTSVPALAGRAARLLGSMGVLVISVDNAQVKTDQCEILGNKAELDSETSRVIKAVLLCKTRLTEEKNAADLRVIIGSAFATRYIAKSEQNR